MFIGYSVSKRKILVVSRDECISRSDDLRIISLPENLHAVPPPDLILNYQVSSNEQVVRQRKIAIVTPFLEENGISDYSEMLLPSLENEVSEIRVFAETKNSEPEDSNVIRCWSRLKSLESLIKEIHKFNPDIILIEHLPAFFYDHHLETLLFSFPKEKTYIRMHSVYSDALNLAKLSSNLLVHTEDALNFLVKNGIEANKISVIPHGCAQNSFKTPSRNYKLIQFGMGYQYKGWLISLRALAALKIEFPSVHLTFILSEQSQGKWHHQTTYAAIKQEIETLGLQSNVTIKCGWLTKSQLTNIAREHCIAVFPYITPSEFFAASGAARTAMTFGLPTIVSSSNMFNDLDMICPRINNANELALIVKSWFTNWKNKIPEQLKKQNEFLAKYKWEQVSKKHIAIFNQRGEIDVHRIPG